MENNKAYKDLLTQREATIMFNRGLHSALTILQKAETLTLEGRMQLYLDLKKQIAESEVDFTFKLLAAMEQGSS